MRNINKILGIVAVIAIIGLSFIACEEDSGFSAPGLLGTKKPAAIPNFTSRAIESEAEANALLTLVQNTASWYIINAAEEVMEEAFDAKYPMSWYFENANKTSISASVSSKDFAAFQRILKDEYGVEGLYSGKFSGSESNSWSSNKTLAQYMDMSYSDFAVGDKLSEKNNAKYDIEITEGAVTWSDWSGTTTYKMAGFITYESKDSMSGTLKEKAGTSLDDDRLQGSEKDSTRWAVSVSIDNGTYGAKIIYATSNASEGSSRASKGASGSQQSDILFYDNAGNLKFTMVR